MDKKTTTNKVHEIRAYCFFHAHWTLYAEINSIFCLNATEAGAAKTSTATLTNQVYVLD